MKKDIMLNGLIVKEADHNDIVELDINNHTTYLSQVDLKILITFLNAQLKHKSSK